MERQCDKNFPISVSTSSVCLCTGHNDCILNYTNAVVPTQIGNFSKKGSNDSWYSCLPRLQGKANGYPRAG